MTLVTSGRELDARDVRAVWAAMKSGWGVTPVNYNTFFGKLVKAYANRSAKRYKWRPSDTIGEVQFSFLRWALLSYDANKGQRPPFKEMDNAVHETHHRFQLLTEKNAPTFYRKYFALNDHFRMVTEVDANMASMSLEYAIYGDMDWRVQLDGMRRIYNFSRTTLDTAEQIFIDRVDMVRRGGRGTATSPVAFAAIKALIGTGFFRRV